MKVDSLVSYSDSHCLTVSHLQRKHEKDSCKDLYAQVKPCRLRRVETTSSSLMPKELLDPNDTQGKGGHVLAEQVGPDICSLSGSQFSI